jgi:hypothetical protein
MLCFSVGNLIQENRLYGPFRLIDVVEKLDLKGPRLEVVQKQIEEGKDMAWESEEEFTGFLENSVMSLVHLMQGRK